MIDDQDWLDGHALRLLREALDKLSFSEIDLVGWRDGSGMAWRIDVGIHHGLGHRTTSAQGATVAEAADRAREALPVKGRHDEPR